MARHQASGPGTTAGVYIDGFDLRRRIQAFGEPFLNWVSLWQLGQVVCARNGHKLTKVVYFTAAAQGETGLSDRHNAFNAAQRALGVTVVTGQHIIDASGVRDEKYTDINLALSALLDARDDLIEAAYVVGPDLDQSATAKIFRERFPKKQLYVVATSAKDVPTKVRGYAPGTFVIGKPDIETCVMGRYVGGANGGSIRRPWEYDPPGWWIHPESRPT